MLSFNLSFEKTQTYELNVRLRRRVSVMVSTYDEVQFAALEADLQAALGEGFVSFSVEDFYDLQTTTVHYNGEIVDDVELDRNTEIDAVYNAWIAEQGV